jgi:hypothetical protein
MKGHVKLFNSMNRFIVWNWGVYFSLFLSKQFLHWRSRWTNRFHTMHREVGRSKHWGWTRYWVRPIRQGCGSVSFNFAWASNSRRHFVIQQSASVSTYRKHGSSFHNSLIGVISRRWLYSVWMKVCKACKPHCLGEWNFLSLPHTDSGCGILPYVHRKHFTSRQKNPEQKLCPLTACSCGLWFVWKRAKITARWNQ